jgi:hypothetical protein
MSLIRTKSAFSSSISFWSVAGKTRHAPGGAEMLLQSPVMMKTRGRDGKFALGIATGNSV